MLTWCCWCCWCPGLSLCTTCSVFSWPHVTTAQSTGPLTLRGGAQTTSPPSQTKPRTSEYSARVSSTTHSCLLSFVFLLCTLASIDKRPYLSSRRLGYLTLPWSMNQKIELRILHLLFMFVFDCLLALGSL